MLLYVIRHGDPCYDPDSLTPLGQRQAEAVGRRLAQVGITRVYSSPLVRAQQTAQPAADHQNGRGRTVGPVERSFHRAPPEKYQRYLYYI